MMIPTVHSERPEREGSPWLNSRLPTIARIDALRQVTVHGRDYYVQGPMRTPSARGNGRAARAAVRADDIQALPRVEAQAEKRAIIYSSSTPCAQCKSSASPPSTIPT
jgi:hypothetical protein